MKSIVVRHRNSGYTTLIIPLAEDTKYWYVLEIQGKKVLDALRKIDFDFMGGKVKSQILKTTFNQLKGRLKSGRHRTNQ